MQTAGRIYTGTKIDQKTFQDYVRPLYMAGLAVRFGLKIADKGKESDPQEEFIKGLEDDQHVIEPDNTEPKSDEIPLWATQYQPKITHAAVVERWWTMERISVPRAEARWRIRSALMARGSASSVELKNKFLRPY